MLLDHQLLLVIDNEQGPAYAARVREQPQLLLLDVVHDGHLSVHVHAAPEGPEGANELVGVAVDANPVPVDKHLGGVQHPLRPDLLEVLGRPLVEELQDGCLGGADGDV
jgi:hypothetical protein